MAFRAIIGADEVAQGKISAMTTRTRSRDRRVVECGTQPGDRIVAEFTIIRGQHMPDILLMAALAARRHA